ncbi:gamma-glutamyl-gamma-aminobutyrate hydrolase family protein [Serinicoccus chungangensis]|uniref:gamma-glutamyl-gamma-aminobutyrate hydrolase family protein n=1 Tax=Serinicoccus chungangensis TaxID=767452 RepID=UPI00111BA2AF|nr:gamma-glutamyl-gamma-aminobutyrate hydrolase family protein [Serinicoccus chungangensis]
MTDRPRIGLTTYYKEAAWGVWRRPAAIVPAVYVEGVAAAGGTPLLLPPVGSDPSVLDVLDGLVLIGGADVDAAQYAGTPHPSTAPEPVRDAPELALARAALEQGVPLLAICRGVQVLNVALGGTLDQHLPDRLGHTAYQPSPGVFGEVTFRTEPGSRIAEVLGPQAASPCYHHQGVDRVADGLVVTARSADGVVQALEPTDSPGWALGVQFHPEENPADRRLFHALVHQAATRTTARPDPRRGESTPGDGHQKAMSRTAAGEERSTA